MCSRRCSAARAHHMQMRAFICKCTHITCTCTWTCTCTHNYHMYMSMHAYKVVLLVLRLGGDTVNVLLNTMATAFMLELDNLAYEYGISHRTKVHVHTYIHTYTHTHIHTYIHTYIQLGLQVWHLAPCEGAHRGEVANSLLTYIRTHSRTYSLTYVRRCTSRRSGAWC